MKLMLILNNRENQSTIRIHARNLNKKIILTRTGTGKQFGKDSEQGVDFLKI